VLRRSISGPAYSTSSPHCSGGVWTWGEGAGTSQFVGVGDAGRLPCKLQRRFPAGGKPSCKLQRRFPAGGKPPCKLQRRFPVGGKPPCKLQRRFPVGGKPSCKLQRRFPVGGKPSCKLQRRFPVGGKPPCKLQRRFPVPSNHPRDPHAGIAVERRQSGNSGVVMGATSHRRRDLQLRLSEEIRHGFCY
jgi:hypothetical protein